MSSKRKKPIDEARGRLEEKLKDVQAKTNHLKSVIDNISHEAVNNAIELLALKSKTRFMSKYSSSSQQLEACLTQLLVITDSISSLDTSFDDDDDDDEESGSTEDEDDNTCISVPTTVVKEHPHSEEKITKNKQITNKEQYIAKKEIVYDEKPSIQPFKLATNKSPLRLCKKPLESPTEEKNEHIKSETSDLSINTISERTSSTNNGSKLRLKSLEFEKINNIFDGIKLENSKQNHAEKVKQFMDIEIEENNFIKKKGTPENHNDSFGEEKSKYASEDDSTFTSVSMVGSSRNETKKKQIIDENTPVEVFKWESDVAYPVIITNVKSPWDFYIQLVSAENDVMEKLCLEHMKEAVNGYKGGIDYVPHAGLYCCAKSPVDEIWYRAKIITVFAEEDDGRGIELEDVSIKVLLIDEGLTYILPLTSLRPLHKKYTSLPSQAFHCILGGIQPKDSKNQSFLECNKLWSEVTCTWFCDIMRDGNVVAAYLNLPPKECYQPPHSVQEGTLVCDLYLNQVNSETKWWKLSYNRAPIDQHIGFMMILEDLAKPCPYFTSLLNLKKSQRALYEAKTTREKGSEKIQVAFCGPVDTSTDLPTKQESSQESNQEKDELKTDQPTEQPAKPKNKPAKKEKLTNANIKKNKKQAKEELSEPPPVTRVTSKNKKKKFGNTASQTFGITSSSPMWKFCSEFLEKDFENSADGFIRIVMSVVVNPGLFYVHVVTPEVGRIDTMMIRLNAFYNTYSKSIRDSMEKHPIKEGTAVVCCLDDKNWYRATVVSHTTSRDGAVRYSVFCIDYGSVEKCAQENVLPVTEEFCVLPKETVACCLADVQPLPTSLTKQNTLENANERELMVESNYLDEELKQRQIYWSEPSVARLKELIPTGDPLMASLKSPKKNANGLYELHLYDTNDDKDLFINQRMVDEGLVNSNVLCKSAPLVSIREEELKREDELQIWDPMQEQYDSERNAYSVNTDDANVATLGYVSQRKEACENFARYGHCYRGKTCKYMHVTKDDPLLDQVLEFSLENTNGVELPEIGDWVAVLLASLYDPTHIWLTFPYGLSIDGSEPKKTAGNEEDLNNLNDDMNEYYRHMRRDDKTDLGTLAECQLIAARYSENNCWYRAKVVNHADGLVQVAFVDYGNTAVINEKDTRKLTPDFLHLPIQAVECYLYNTKINREAFGGENYQENSKFVEMRLKFRDWYTDKVLMAQIQSRSANGSICVELYDTSTSPHTHINELIRSWYGIVGEKPKKQVESNLARLQKHDAAVKYIPA